jgi:tetratricopeptide (TPR) repeat protein
MNKNQIIAVVSCAVLCMGVYLFTSIRKPKDDKVAPSTAQAETTTALNMEEYVAETSAMVQNDTLRNQIEKLTEKKDYQGLVDAFAKMDKPLVVVYYLQKKAASTNSVTDWVGLGDFSMMLLQTAPDEKAKNYLNTTAIESYQAALAIDSSVTDNRLRLASAYMEGGAQPMQGVSILIDIVRKDSTNVDALLMLGRFGLISGQYDKAIARLEKILYLQPQNSEALLMLAEAHNNLGHKEEALKLLEKCKKTVKSPELKSEIDKYIQSIKKPS